MSDSGRNLRVVTFAPMPPTITGGIEEYAYSVIEEMRKLGIDVKVVTSKFKTSEIRYPPENNEFIYIRSAMFFKRPVPMRISVLIKICSAIHKADAVHIHMPYPFIESFAACIAKLFNKKIIITYHMDAKIDAESIYEKEPVTYSIIQKLYYLISGKWPLLYSDVICTNTKAYAKSSPILVKYLDKVKVVYQGIRRDLYDCLDVRSAQDMRSRYLGNKYAYLVTFVGRLVPYKGIQYLLEAIRSIGAERKILFIIGGNGPQKEYLIELTKKNNLENVVFLGFVKDKDLFNLFAASDLVVSPSISELESTPISLLSALAAGTSVIGTSIGGTAETIPNDGVNGAIISPKDSEALATMILRMIDGSKGKLKDAGRQRFWSDVAKEYIELLRQPERTHTETKIAE